MRKHTRLTAVLAATVLAFSSLGATATAAPTTEAQPEQPESALTHELSDAELEEAAAASEELFGTLLNERDGEWTVNQKAAAKSNVPVEQLEAIANSFNGKNRDGSPRITPQHSVNSQEYRDCVINATGLGALVDGAAGGGPQLAYLLAVKNWKDAAFVIVKLVGVNAVKGGVAGLAATLAGAGAWCATPWAN